MFSTDSNNCTAQHVCLIRQMCHTDPDPDISPHHTPHVS